VHILVAAVRDEPCRALLARRVDSHLAIPLLARIELAHPFIQPREVIGLCVRHNSTRIGHHDDRNQLCVLKQFSRDGVKTSCAHKCHRARECHRAPLWCDTRSQQSTR
jgi:hypothetical protein